MKRDYTGGMSEPPLIVTLDGPAGSGKSTVARRLAQCLGLEFLDTGAMYRGLTARSIDTGCEPVDVAASAVIAFDWSTDPPRLLVNGVDVTDRLRDADVSELVSPQSAIPRVRQVMVKAQQQIGREHPRLVTEGRDQGSVVFPDAQVKFYLDAHLPERARRRAEQIRETGRGADQVQIEQDLQTRDHRDSTRADGPLVCAEDALRVDTTDMTLDEVVEHLEQIVRQQMGTAAGEG